VASWPAKIATLTVVGAALLGAAYDGLGLMDRLGFGKQAQVGTGQNTDPSKRSTIEAEPVAMVLPKPKMDPPADPSREPEPQTPARDPLTEAVEARLLSELERLGCTGVTLDPITIAATETPAAEASSGFDTIYLEGTATLSAGAVRAVIAFAGSGKGPGRAVRATEMVAKGFAGALPQDDIGQSCTGLETQ